MKHATTIRPLTNAAALAAALSVCIRPAVAQTTYENPTYKLTQSTEARKYWTTPPTEKPFKTTAVPTATGSEVKIFAARNEFEPFFIVYQPTSSGAAAVTVGSFGSGIEVELYQVKHVNITTATDYLGGTGDYPDPLWPLASGASVPVAANQNTAFWFSVKVPKTTPAGDYYDVTVGVGNRFLTRYHTVWVEGTRLINDEATTGTAIIRSTRVRVMDKKLTLTIGKYDRITFINYVDIEAVANPVAITTAASLPTGAVNLAWSQTLAATGGTAPYLWSIVSGSLPAELSLSSGGVLSGTPAAAGSFVFTARATDQAAGYAEQEFTLDVLTPYSYWKTTKFSTAELANPAISGSDADSDTDGLPNLLEFAFALAPKTADAGGNLPALGESGGYPTFSYRQNKQAMDLTYTIEASPDLSTGS